MAQRLCVGDTVLVYVNHDNNNDDNKYQTHEHSGDVQIGVIKYMGYIDGYLMSQYVGIELVESIDNGHDGTINGNQYFQCYEGHGIYTRITNIIRKLSSSEIASKMQEIVTLFKTRLNQYVSALSERDQYIEKLKSKQRYLRQLLNESKINYIPNALHRDSGDIVLFKPQNQSNNNFSTSIMSNNNNKQKDTRTSEIFPSRGIIPTPITPMTLTPFSDDTAKESICCSVQRPSDATIIHHDVIRKRNVIRNKNDNFPDTEMINLYNSSICKPRPNSFLVPPTLYNKYSAAATEESLSKASYYPFDDDDGYDVDDKYDAASDGNNMYNNDGDDELRDEYDDNSSLEENNNNKHIERACLFSPYSTEKSISNDSVKANDGKNNNNNNNKKEMKYKSMKISKSKSVPLQQQQYVYSHTTQENMNCNRNKANTLIPMRSNNNMNYHPMQRQLFIPSSNPINNNNINSEYNYNQNINHQQILYSVPNNNNNNNNNVFWMQHQ